MGGDHDQPTAEAVANDARAMGVPINAADRPALCDFITPAVIKRGAVQIAIGTGGASPALARRLRERLETIVGPEYGALAEILRRVRPWLRERVENPDERARTMLSLIDGDLLDAIRRDDWPAIEGLLQTHLGVGLRTGFGLAPRVRRIWQFRSANFNGSNLPAPTLRQP